jgi:hypothetical protein
VCVAFLLPKDNENDEKKKKRKKQQPDQKAGQIDCRGLDNLTVQDKRT